MVYYWEMIHDMIQDLVVFVAVFGLHASYTYFDWIRFCGYLFGFEAEGREFYCLISEYE